MVTFLIRAGVLAVVLLGLANCALVTTPKTTIEIDLKQAAASYADIRQVYAMLAHDVGLACQQGQLTPARCEQAQELNRQALDLDARIMRTLRTPGVEPDWPAIRAILGVLISLLIL